MTRRDQWTVMAADADERVILGIEGRLATIALNRPDKLNALTLRMLADLETAAHDVAGSDARVVVIMGHGRAFTAGMDLDTFRSGQLFQADADLRYDAASLGANAAAAIEGLPQVTIAALQGSVIGGGVVLAAACDLRVAERSTTFAIPEVDVGIPLAWGGIERLVREFGPAMTKELVITCRPFSAGEAQTAGFVNRIVDDGLAIQTALDLAEAIAAKPRFPVRTTKQHVSEIVAGDMSRDDALGLLAAIEDPESARARAAYLARHAGRT
jgi:enoyl-CoA hydratase/carnithine racemase